MSRSSLTTTPTAAVFAVAAMLVLPCAALAQRAESGPLQQAQQLDREGRFEEDRKSVV